MKRSFGNYQHDSGDIGDTEGCAEAPISKIPKGNPEEYLDILFNANNNQSIASLIKEDPTDKQKEKNCVNLVMDYFNNTLNEKSGEKIWHAEKIAKGGFGTVLKVEKRNEITKTVEISKAIKVIPNVKMAYSEAICAARLRSHPNVITVHNLLSIVNICCIEMEYLSLGSLQDLMDNPNQKISSKIIFKMMFQCCEVLMLMKQNQMVHSDIKPANILVKRLDENDVEIVISDFGLSLQSETIMDQTVGGTANYCAPELLDSNGKLSKNVSPTFQSDIFSIGKTFRNLFNSSINEDWVTSDVNEMIRNLESEDIVERERGFYYLCFNGIVFFNITRSVVWEYSKIYNILSKNYNTTNCLPSKNRDFILQNSLLEYAHESLRKDRDLVLELARKNINVLEFVDQELRTDKKFAFEIVRRNIYALEFVDKSFRKDRDFVLELVKQNFKALEFMDESFRKDRGIVIELVKQNVKALEFTDESFRKDREFILELVKQNADTLEFVDESFKKDREIVWEAVKKNIYVFKFADESFKKDREFILELARQKGNILKFIDVSFRKDREIVLEAVKRDDYALQVVDKSLRKDREFVLEAVKQNSNTFPFADESLRKDREIVLELVKRNDFALQLAHKSLRKDREIILEAVKKSGYVLQLTDESLRKDREIVLAAVKRHGYALEFADESLKKDREIVLAAVKQNGYALEFADESLRKDREIVLEAVKQNGQALKFADESLRKDREIVLLIY